VSFTDLRSDAPGFVHEVRRKLPRYHWRPLYSIRTGEALARPDAHRRHAPHRPGDELRARREDARAGRLRFDDRVSLVGYVISAVLALYLFWKIVRTPGDL
jgi:hypothetical protein